MNGFPSPGIKTTLIIKIIKFYIYFYDLSHIFSFLYVLLDFNLHLSVQLLRPAFIFQASVDPLKKTSQSRCKIQSFVYVEHKVRFKHSWLTFVTTFLILKSRKFWSSIRTF